MPLKNIDKECFLSWSSKSSSFCRLSNNIKIEMHIYTSIRCLVWVWILVSYFSGRTQIEDLRYFVVLWVMPQYNSLEGRKYWESPFKLYGIMTQRATIWTPISSKPSSTSSSLAKQPFFRHSLPQKILQHSKPPPHGDLETLTSSKDWHCLMIGC
jgi:hypothetical protein